MKNGKTNGTGSLSSLMKIEINTRPIFRRIIARFCLATRTIIAEIVRYVGRKSEREAVAYDANKVE